MSWFSCSSVWVVFSLLYDDVHSLAVVLIVAFYVFGVQTIRDNIANNNIKQEEKNLLQIEDLDKNVTIQNQLSAINKTHEDKLMTSRILGILSVISQKGTPNDLDASKRTFR